ncbi:MAG: preprotein translocase subunit SecY [Hadesarchaea archaeon]|nr:preprotein translocase subunit SecY [Hadesarchaea archaeon]
MRSKLYVLEPLVQRLPEISVPKRHIDFKEKLMWSGVALIIFLVMTQITLYGVTGQAQNWFGNLRYVLASRAGTLMQLGIGPIVTSGIIMQLLSGANLIGLDLNHPRDRALFTGTQKILAIVVGAFQATAFVMAGSFGSVSALGIVQILFLILQLLLGVITVLFLDELVSKYGFGSGISLFIAGGVSAQVFMQAFNFTAPEGIIRGAIPQLISALASGSPGAISNAFFRSGYPNMMGFLATMVVFFIVIYAETTRVEIPLAYSEYGGLRGRYPIKFLYASVIPVILSLVLFTNFRILGRILGGPVHGFVSTVMVAPRGLTGPGSVAASPLPALGYTLILIGSCMAFAWLWVQMTNMSPKDVAQQLKRSGMSIPGFRKDIRIMEKMLSRYITPVTLLGGAFVGALAAGADALGALSSGTGILLTVSIIYRLYQEIARERVSEMFPAARRLLGES